MLFLHSLRSKGSRLLVLRGTPQDVLPRVFKVRCTATAPLPRCPLCTLPAVCVQDSERSWHDAPHQAQLPALLQPHLQPLSSCQHSLHQVYAPDIQD